MAAKKKATNKRSENSEVKDLTTKLSTPEASADEKTLDTAAETGSQALAEALDVTTPQIDPEEQAPNVEKVSTDGTTAEPEQPEVEQQQQRDLDPTEGEVSSAMVDKLGRQPAEPSTYQQKQATKEAKADAKAKKKTDSPSMKRLGAIGEKLPGSEKIRIHKRMDDGKLGYIGDYSLEDLSQSQNIEEYVSKYLKGKYGAGEYQVTAINAYGQEFDAGAVVVLDPITEPTAAPGSSALDILNAQLSREQSRRDRDMDRIRTKPEKDPVQSISELMDIQERVNSSTKKEADGTMGALIQAMGSQTNAMLQMMMQQQAKSEERMVDLMSSKKDSDPLMVALVSKLIDDKGSSKEMPAPAPPPPPPNPTEDLKNMAEVLAALQPKNDSNSELIKYLLTRAETERMTPKDVLGLVNDAKSQQTGTDDFKKSMDNLTLMMTAINAIKTQTEGGPTGVWDALAALASNQDVATTIGTAIRSISSNVVPIRPNVQQPTLPAMTATAEDLERRAAAIERERVALAQRRLAVEKNALDEEITQNPTAHRPRQTMPPQSPAQPQPQPQAPAPVATAEQEAAVQREVERRGGSLPELPPEISDHINNMILAPDDAALVEAVVRLLFYLAELPDWDQVAETIITLIRNGDKENVLAFLTHFFGGLQSIKMTDQALTDRVLTAVDAHFNIIAEKINEAEEVAEEAEEAKETEEEIDNDPESA